MGYQPIYDGEFNVALYGEPIELELLLKAVFKQKLIMTNFVKNGSSRHADIAIRGTRRQFMAWLNDYYDADHSLFDRANPEFVASNKLDEVDWKNAVEAFGLTFVA